MLTKAIPRGALAVDIWHDVILYQHRAVLYPLFKPQMLRV